MNSSPKHIVITGASSGIGEALALHYAAPGVRLGLTGRNGERLENVAERCRVRGAEIETIVLSVTEENKMREWLEKIDDRQPIDVLIANAGVSAGMGHSRNGEKAQQVRHLFDVNLYGVFNTIDPVLPRMIKRGSGHIALMSSMASFSGWPGAPAYSASKAAVRVYGEALRGSLADSGVQIHVICPGFVKSRITDANEFPMPFFMQADKAASIIANGIARNKGRIAFPWPTYFIVWFLSVIPGQLASRLLRGLPAKRENF